MTDQNIKIMRLSSGEEIISKIVGNFTGYNPAGIILYDKPWRNETKFEKFIGKYIGFCYNINITK